MLHNPSHLEAVNPVSMGKTRSKQQTLRDGAFSSDSQKQFGSNVINVQVYSSDFMHIHLVSQRINSFFGFHRCLLMLLLLSYCRRNFLGFFSSDFSCTGTLHSAARE